MSSIFTERLELVTMTLPLVEAIMLGDRQRAEREIDATLPEAWPGRRLVELAFNASIDDIRADPEVRLWGDRLCLPRSGPRRVLGSVVFHGRPDNGIAEIGYGIAEDSQGQGLATEATRACIDWAFEHAFITAVRATTFTSHLRSLSVMRKIGMRHVATEQHDALGELHTYEIKKG